MKTFCVAFLTLFVKTYSSKIQRLPNRKENKKLSGVELKIKRSTTYTAGSESCIDYDHCWQSEAIIGDNSCHGFAACVYSKGNIGHGSCLHDESCYYANGLIGDDSCFGGHSCSRTVANIGDHSCLHGESCYYANGLIGDESCLGEYSCSSIVATIGDQSCHGEYSCVNSAGTIADNSCLGENSCFRTVATIADNSCHGNYSCERTSGTIGEHSCTTDYGCQNHVGAIGDYSCTTLNGCSDHEGDIPSNCGSVAAMEDGFCPRTVLHGQACRYEKKNLGLFETPEQCMDAAMSDSVCTGSEIMWSDSYHSWGCRCCSEHLTCPPATSDYYSNSHWDIYEYRNCRTFPENVEPNKQCIRQSKNLGAGFSTPEECMAAAASDSGCTGQEIMWSDSYSYSSSSWGCRCCSENSTCKPDYSSYPSNSNWDVYRYGECP